MLSQSVVFIPAINVTRTEKKKLEGTASQLRRLVLLFPAAVAESVQDFEDPVWEMILRMRTICSIICAPALSYGQVAILQLEIDKYLRLRIKCFPEEKLIPKHEYLRHYPMLIKHFGPLKHVWTLRFESKHGEFKTHIRHFTNFKNITQSLAERHQLKMAAFPSIDQSIVEANNAVEYISNAYDTAVRLLVSETFKDETTDNIRYVSEKVTFCGIEYRSNMCVCIGINEFGNFIVCRIQYIIINSSYTSIAFIGIANEIIFNSYFGVYENECEGEVLSTFPYSSLLSPDPIPEVKIFNVTVYLPKYAFLDPDS